MGGETPIVIKGEKVKGAPRLEEHPWTKWQIYISHALTAWGDRLWMFAVGLYLAVLFPESFQYTAIYGLVTSVVVILGGPYVGTWVDRTSRLRAATLAITVQNFAVTACAVMLIILIEYSEEIRQAWNGHLQTSFLLAIIIFGCVGELAASGSKIAIEKDWIVVLAENDEGELSKMNAIMRTIDLTTNILAPAVVAQIIAFISRIAGAAFIAGWNIVSGGFEIYLLHQVFQAIPELANKSMEEESGAREIPKINIIQSPGTPQTGDFPTTPVQNEGLAVPDYQRELIPTPRGVSLGLPMSAFSEVKLTPLPKLSLEGSGGGTPATMVESPTANVSSVQKLVKKERRFKFYQDWSCSIFKSLDGWRIYFSHPVRWAGMGLALLYMTVLSFDSITIGYMYSQGVNESLIGMVGAAGALLGILGTLSFPLLRKILGKCTVGNFGFGFETTCLVLCLVSICLPGSPFLKEKMAAATDYTSVTVFTIGIILSRYGLWIADLTVTLFFQETVEECHRGVINGVQDSLNQAFSLVKFILVIALPNTPTFGYLIIISWLFIFMGWVSFMVFTWSWRRRFHKVKGDDEHQT